MRIITRSRLCLISLTLAGLCLATTSLAARSTNAVAAKGNGPTYQVKSGDSLDRIAKKSGTTVAELQRLNQLSSSALKPGQKLRLPVATTKSSGKKTTAKPKTSKPVSAKPTGTTAATHQVKKGESLYQIARRHKIGVADLQRWNNLSGTALKPGQSLLLGEKTEPKPSAGTPATQPDPTAEYQIHIVAKGQSLYQIARSNAVSVDELVQLNNLKSHHLRPGQQLRLAALPKGPTEEIAEPAANPAVAGATALPPAAEVVHQINEDESAEVEVSAAQPPSAAGMEEGAASYPPTTGDSPPLAVAASNQQRLAQTISKLRNLPYRFGGNGVKGIDCSGFVQKVFREFAIELPRSAREQYRLGVAVEKSSLRQGDLVFFRTYAKYPSHVGIYLGDNKMVHASTRSRKVVISDITQSYYTKRYIGAKRLVDQEAENFRIEEVKDLLQEENADEDSPEGFTGRRAAPTQRSVATPG